MFCPSRRCPIGITRTTTPAYAQPILGRFYSRESSNGRRKWERQSRNYLINITPVIHIESSTSLACLWRVAKVIWQIEIYGLMFSWFCISSRYTRLGPVITFWKRIIKRLSYWLIRSGDGLVNIYSHCQLCCWQLVSKLLTFVQSCLRGGSTNGIGG